MKRVVFAIVFAVAIGGRWAAGQAPGPETSPSPSPGPGLKLGPYGRPHSDRELQTLLQTPRFESRVDVLAHVPPDLNVTMQVWWRHYDFENSIYGRGYNIQKPVHPGAVNLLPLIEWLTKKVKKE